MNNTYREQYLRHYGVLGMKWGRKKGTITKPTTSKKSNGDNATIRKMSNKELNARLKRLRLEQEYTRLSGQAKPETISTIDKLLKNTVKVGALTTTALTVYKNLNDLTKIGKGVYDTGKKVYNVAKKLKK